MYVRCGGRVDFEELSLAVHAVVTGLLSRKNSFITYFSNSPGVFDILLEFA
jgi:hypothetical protein